MLRAFFALFAACSMTACGTADPRVDVFVWDRLFADGVAENAQEMGRIDRDGFESEMENFEWLEQALVAYRTKRVSPTLSVTDLYTDHTFFISSAVNADSGDPTTLGYFIGYMAPGTNPREGRISYLYETENMELIRGMVALFFDRNFEMLESLLDELPLYAEPYATREWDREILRELKEKYK